MIELDEKGKGIIKHALEVYLSDLREEIVKTETHKWKSPLHEEEAVIKKVIASLSEKSSPSTFGGDFCTRFPSCSREPVIFFSSSWMSW